MLEHVKTWAKALGLQIRPYYIKGAKDIDQAFDELKKLQVNALLMPGGAIATLNSRRITELATKLRLPAMYQTRTLVEDGGLMAYGVNLRRPLPVGCHLRRQDSQGKETQRTANRTADKVRIRDQSKNRKADRPDDPAERAGASGQSDQMTEVGSQRSEVTRQRKAGTKLRE